jgi:hypothetical protein
MRRLDPERLRLPVRDARAIEAATREGATLGHLEAIGAWLETPAAEWWRAKGYHVAGWSSVLGADGTRWRERHAEATAGTKAAGNATKANGAKGQRQQGWSFAGMGPTQQPEREYIDVEVVSGNEKRDLPMLPALGDGWL